MATYGWKYGTTMGNVLDPFDQLTFDAERATGVTSIPHPFWVYNRPVDLDGLREVGDRLAGSADSSATPLRSAR